MRYKTLLNGINAKCKQCALSCKQFKQVTVCYCKNFQSIVSNKNTATPSKHKKAEKFKRRD